MQQLTFKEFEHQAWLKAVPQYDASFSRLTQQTIPAILSVLDLRAEMSLLDVACGPGYLAAAAHRQGVHATGVDFSSAMIVRARENHPGIHFAEGDAEDLQQFPDAAFDSVAMNFGIIHLAHPELALKAAHRVLKPSGKMAFTAWCKPQEAIGFSFVLQAVEKFGNPHVELPVAPPLFFYSDPDNCKQVLLRCGFLDPQVQLVSQTWELRFPDELFEAFFKGTARTAGLLKGQSVEQLMAIRDEIRRFVNGCIRDGKIALPMPAYVAWGRKSAG